MTTSPDASLTGSVVEDLGWMGRVRRLSIDGVEYLAKGYRGRCSGGWAPFAEYLAAQIAHALELPVPHFGVVEFEAALWFCSRRISDAVPLPVEALPRVVNPDQLCGVGVFDLWMGIQRQPETILAERLDGVALRAWAVDHKQAFFAIRTRDTGETPQAPRVTGPRPLPEAELSARAAMPYVAPFACPVLLVASLGDLDALMPWVAKIQAISREQIVAWIEATPLVWRPYGAFLAELPDYLIERQRHLGPILQSQRERLAESLRDLQRARAPDHPRAGEPFARQAVPPAAEEAP